MKAISILGSTGSIGTQTLDVIRQHPDQFQAVALVTYSNIDLLEQQIAEFKPIMAGVVDEKAYIQLKERYDGPTEIVGGKEALSVAATLPEAMMVVTAVVGAAGIEPTMAAIRAQKTIGLANKETLVACGSLITKAAQDNGVSILPIDSEHSAIFQCLEGQDRSNVEKLIVTASGGALRHWKSDDLYGATAKDCLAHPTWNMGNKITIDSATLFNKGLEVIEAHWLFDFDYDHIDVVVHPQSIVHSMIQMNDGAILAQLGNPDMREPIQYAMTYPKRYPLQMEHLDFTKGLDLQFMAPRWDDFPALRLAFTVGKEGGYAPAVFNAANEMAVYALLDERITYGHIYEVVSTVLGRMINGVPTSIEEVLAMDGWARREATKEIQRRSAC